jgi:hypothetical protein
MLTIDNIKQAVLILAPKYDVSKVELFGSYANGVATENSDADFLVRFSAETPSIFKVLGFKAELTKALNHPVDVVTLPLKKPDKLKIDKVVSIYERA